ncbi:hypothetical protein [Chitinolyticbacter meiyuanensis]|uniref:hypothetical protein n=1 Tax=Chitinolyticbacter meiyuanensis TaxID=682798 RepID=UPI0011E5B455|nr:hypothetical protein [Chitinolyticbacter meiyuanensis]
MLTNPSKSELLIAATCAPLLAHLLVHFILVTAVLIGSGWRSANEIGLAMAVVLGVDLLVNYVVLFAVGLPLILLLRRFNLAKPLLLISAGFVAGAVPFAWVTALESGGGFGPLVIGGFGGAIGALTAGWLCALAHWQACRRLQIRVL